VSRRRRIVIFGLPYFGGMLAEILRRRGWDARFSPHPGRSLIGWLRLLPLVARADAVYLIGSRMERGSPQEWLIRLRRGLTLIHWVGTDVLIAAEAHAEGRGSRLVAERAVHWCDAPWLVDELAQLGATGSYQPLPIVGLAGEAPPLPERFCALLYLPVDAYDREVFDMDTAQRLPFAFPDEDFVIIPSTRESLAQPLPANVRAPGWIEDMDALYRSVTVVLRLTSHDGTSFMILEALSRGRHAIWTFAMPGVRVAKGFDAVSAALREMIEAHHAGALVLNESGMAHARGHFDPGATEAAIDRRLRELLRGRSGRRA
jgi:hypothetical protein